MQPSVQQDDVPLSVASFFVVAGRAGPAYCGNTERLLGMLFCSLVVCQEPWALLQSTAIPWLTMLHLDTGIGRDIDLESRKSPTVSGSARDHLSSRDGGQSGNAGSEHSSTAAPGAPRQAAGNAELAADLDVPTDSSPNAEVEEPARHDASPNVLDEKPFGSADADQAHRSDVDPPGSLLLGNDSAATWEARQVGTQPNSQTEGGPSRQATNGQATRRQQTPSQKRPPRSLPSSRGGSAEALDTQGGPFTPPLLWPGSSSAVPGDPGSDGPPSRRFAPSRDVGMALDKQVSCFEVQHSLQHAIALNGFSYVGTPSVLCERCKY